MVGLPVPKLLLSAVQVCGGQSTLVMVTVSPTLTEVSAGLNFIPLISTAVSAARAGRATVTQLPQGWHGPHGG